MIIIITPEKDRMSGGHGRPFFAPQQWVCATVILCFWDRAGKENARGAIRISGSWWYAKLCHWI